MPGNNNGDELNPRLPDGVVIEDAESFAPSDMLKAGAALMQTKAQYTTAVKVLKPRDVEKVIQAVEKEAALAGEDFYYSYPQGGKYVEGPGIGGAEILARNWGNCAVNVRIQTMGELILAYPDFIDFETGFNLTRPYIGKKKTLRGRNGQPIYDRDRNDEIVAQVIISKATRNVILNAVPNYVIDAGMRKAKEGISRKLEQYIKEKGIEKARDQIVARAGRLNVPEDKLEYHFGKRPTWEPEKLLRIGSVLKGIEDGYQSVDDAFPKGEEEQKPGNEQSSPNTQKKDTAEKESRSRGKGKKDAPKAEEKSDPPPQSQEQSSDGTLFGGKEKKETDYHSISSVIARVERINSLPEMKNWKQKHYNDLNMFPPEDLTEISKAIARRELELAEANR